ncbi:MAG: hypothetical protein KC469_11780 [Flavobacteriaceae bacterium]|nr:hypothetical protein [Flavobacteriaceae bacterium]
MHINSDRLIESLTEVELMHINNCTQCAMERQKLVALKISANQINVEKPPNLAWENIAKSLPVDKKKNNRIKEIVYACAASFFMVSVGWLMWSNYQLQGKLEQVLFANQHLELQLKHEQHPSFYQAKLLSQINQLEHKLIKAQNEKEKLSLLNTRYKLMKKMVDNQKGINREYSI